MKKKLLFSLIIGVILSTAALYLAFRHVPFKDLAAYVTSINYFWLVPSLLVGQFTFVLRALRWQIILASTRRIGFWPLFHPMMIGFMMNSVLPGRVGEIARPIILKKSDQVPFSTGLATVVLERMFDITLIITIFAVVFFSVSIDPDMSMTFSGFEVNRQALIIVSRGMMVAFGILIAAIVLITLTRARRLMIRAILQIPTLFFFLGQTWKDKLTEKGITPLVQMIDLAAKGFSMIRHPGKVGICFGLSFGIWILQVLSMYILALGCPGIAISFLEMSAVLVIICFFIALPSVPGFWGLWEAGGVFALAIFGISTREAAGFTLAHHAVSMLPVILIGIVSAVIAGVNITQVSLERK